MAGAPSPPPPPAPPPEDLEALPDKGSLREIDPAVLLDLMRFYSVVRDVLIRCGVPEGDAPDVAQAVVLYAAPRWATLPIPPDELAGKRRRAYLIKITFGFAANFRTAELRREELAIRAALAAAPDVVPTPEELVLRKEADAERAADVAIEELRTATRPEFWSVFYAHDVEGLPVSTIARLEETPVATVYTRLRLARRDLRAAITRKRDQREREERRTARTRNGAR